MYTPSFRIKNNGVPILSKEDIDIIGERFVRDFSPEIIEKPSAVDIDTFIESYLGMTPDYQFLSNNGIYLGMTVFNDTDKVIIYSPTTKRAEYLKVKARTVIIDNSLLEENQEHRYRFTVGHEAGHDIFHSGYFSYNPNQLSLFDDPLPAMIQCRADTSSKCIKKLKYWDDKDWMEWQANRLSSAILMPKTSVINLMKLHKTHWNKLFDKGIMIWQVSETFNVSPEAATYRLKDLGYIEKNDTTNYAKDVLTLM